jgi:signal transduction histidine kinase
MKPSFDQVLARGGRSGALIASLDWSSHRLGPIEDWPPSLKNALSICLVSKTPILVWWGNELSELVEFYNDAYQPMLGKAEEPRTIGVQAHAVWHSLEPLYQGVLSKGEASEHRDSFVFLDRHGFEEEAYLDHAHTPLYEEDGRISGVFSTVRETTSRVLNERRLRTLKALAVLASRTHDARTLGQESADLLYENAADIPFCMVFGVRGSRYELLGGAGIAEGNSGAGLAIEQVIASGKPVLVESQIEPLPREAHGRKPPVRAYVVPIRKSPDEPPSAVLVTGLSPHLQFDESYRDFVELAADHLGAALARCAAEQEPDSLLTAASTILRQAPLAIALVHGPDFVFELANARCERMFGGSSLVGQSMREVLTPLCDAERAPIVRALAHVRETGEVFRENEFAVTPPSSTSDVPEAYFMFYCQPLTRGQLPADRIVAVALDVTEQVKLRRELETMSRERQQALTQEQEARAAAEAANRVKDEFLAVLGHELRNPLAPITTALALMRQKAPPEHEAVIIERQVGHLRRLVEDLLDVSRITRGKVELKKRPLNLASVVREAIELASPLLEERQQHLQLDLPATGLDVLGDRTRLAQVLANLLTNASKYSDRAALIVVRGRRLPGENAAEISVRDHGIGIEPDMLSSVWNAFTQGAQAIDRSHGGLGLGLTIVHSLVALHGGSVAAYSAGKGQGSEFCVRLPLAGDLANASDAPDRPLRPSQTHAGVFGGYKVLLVDDNEDAVELLAEWFRMRGASVETALDGLSALEVAKRFEPDVALLDLGLPALSGYDVARRLREQDAHRDMLLIAVTGYGEQSARDETSAAGFDDHCVKPLDLTQFELRLRDQLAER